MVKEQKENKEDKQKKFGESKKVFDNTSGKVWVSLDLEDIKSLGLDVKKVTGSDVNKKVREELGLKERERTRTGITKDLEDLSDEKKTEFKQKMKEARLKILKLIKGD